MRLLKPFLLFITSIALAGCSTTKFTTDYDKSTDFSLLKTYKWGENSIQLKKGPQTSDVIIKRVATMVRDDVEPILNQEFANKDFRLINDGKADMTVQYSAVGDTTNEFRKSDINARNVAPGSAMQQTGAMVLGEITLNIIIPETGKVIWSGKCDAIITGDGTSNRRLKKILAELVKDFPPK